MVPSVLPVLLGITFMPAIHAAKDRHYAEFSRQIKETLAESERLRQATEQLLREAEKEFKRSEIIK